MTRKLVVADGRTEREVLLVGTLVVGRDPMCEISGDNSLLSRRHAEFAVRDGVVVVRDLGSRNGVFVNGVKAAERSLRSGDSVQVGHLQLRYVEGEAPVVTPSTSAPPMPAVDDDDYTRMVPAPRPAPRAVTDHLEDDEYTRMVPAPARRVPPSPSHAPDNATLVMAAPVDTGHVPLGEDEEYTRLVRPPVTPARPQAPRQPDARPDDVTPMPMVATPPRRAARVAPGAWTTFVFVQVTAAAVVTSVAFLVPLAVLAGASLSGTRALGFLASFAVALLAAYVVATRIARRTLDALDAMTADVDHAVAGSLDLIGDALGATPTKNLADSVNRLVTQVRVTADKQGRHDI